MTDELETAENAILAKHGLSKVQVAEAAQFEPGQRSAAEHACITELQTLWLTSAPVVVADAAVTVIAGILRTLPLAARTAVLQRAFVEALPDDEESET